MTREEALKDTTNGGYLSEYSRLTVNKIYDAHEAELQAYKAKLQELEAKYNQLMHKHDLVCHDNCQNLCWENEESYCKEEGCIRNYINPSLYIGIYEDKYKPRELDK